MLYYAEDLWRNVKHIIAEGVMLQKYYHYKIICICYSSLTFYTLHLLRKMCKSNAAHVNMAVSCKPEAEMEGTSRTRQCGEHGSNSVRQYPVVSTHII